MKFIQPVLSAKLRFRLLVHSIASSLTLVLAIALVVVLTIEGFTGSASQPPLSQNGCTHAYYSSKYGNLSLRVMTVYISSFTSLILQIAICIMVFPPLIMRVPPSQARLCAAYLLVSLHLLGIIIGFSSFLTFQIDFNLMDSSCSITSASVLITVILSLSSADLFTSLLQFIFTLWAIKALQSDLSREHVYSVVNNITNTTENQQSQQQTYLREYLQKLDQERPKGQQKPIEADFQSPQFPRKESLAFSSINQLAMKPGGNHKTNYAREQPTIEMQADYSRPKHQRANALSEESSFSSMTRQDRPNYERIANQPGPVQTVAARQEQFQRTNRNTNGYLKFVRRMHPNFEQPQGELVTIIRGKESRVTQ